MIAAVLISLAAFGGPDAAAEPEVAAEELLRVEAVRKELRVDAQQVRSESLSEKQKKRLEEVRLQVLGPRAAFENETVDRLALTQEQRTRLAVVRERVEAEAAKFRTERYRSPEALREAKERRLGEAYERIEAVLTDEQKKRLKEPYGEPFEGAFAVAIRLMPPEAAGDSEPAPPPMPETRS